MQSPALGLGKREKAAVLVTL